MKAIAIAILLIISNNLLSAETSGWRNILDLGCHDFDGTCYVTLDGAPVTGSPGCSSNSIRWNAQSDINGKSTLAIMMMANATGSKVSIYTDKCYPAQAAFPQLTYSYTLRQ